jgi:hypothetical protein
MHVVVVHQTFVYKGQNLPRGTVLTGSEAESLKAKPQFRRFFSPVAEKHYAHLPKDAIIKPNGLNPIIDDLAETKSGTSTAAPAPAVATAPAAAPPVTPSAAPSTATAPVTKS